MKIKVLHNILHHFSILIALVVLTIAMSSDRFDAQKIVFEETDTEIVELFEKLNDCKIGCHTHLFFIDFFNSAFAKHLCKENNYGAQLALDSQASNRLFLLFQKIKIPTP